MLHLHEEIERAGGAAFRLGKNSRSTKVGAVKSAAGLDLTSILIERAKADIELFDFLMASLEALVGDPQLHTPDAATTPLTQQRDLNKG